MGAAPVALQGTVVDDRDVMKAIYGQLSDALAKGQVAAQSYNEGSSAGVGLYLSAVTFGMFGSQVDPAVAGGVRDELAAVAHRVADLSVDPDGEISARVFSGEKDLEWWKSYATPVRATIDDALKNLKVSAYSWGNVWTDVVVRSAEDVKAGLGKAADLVESAAKGFSDLVPWLVVGIVALLIGYVLFHVF